MQIKELNTEINKLNNTISKISSENSKLSTDKDFAQKQYQNLKSTKECTRDKPVDYTATEGGKCIGNNHICQTLPENPKRC